MGEEKNGTSEKLMTRADLAAALGKNPQTITKWAAAGMPVAEPGKRGRGHRYRLPDVLAWREQRDAVQSGNTIDLTAARTRKELAQAIVNELRAAQMRRDLLPREEVERQKIAENAAIRAKLVAWSTTLADQIQRTATRDGVAGVEILLERAVYEALDQLADVDGPIACPNCGADMTDQPEDEKSRCRARTAKGGRCKNDAGPDGYCHIPSHKAAA